MTCQHQKPKQDHSGRKSVARLCKDGRGRIAVSTDCTHRQSCLEMTSRRFTDSFYEDSGQGDNDNPSFARIHEANEGAFLSNRDFLQRGELVQCQRVVLAHHILLILLSMLALCLRIDRPSFSGHLAL
ncbi:unnamed protein product [Protopolystoma xenopodis]|uniref:Uncharacterized protein n=1 Tax=Protopolystoma xenopodis TaxID=117903 RepID=A0A448WN15_9PLAT|nr:unnamed protein product [Protopolystoma xenopodis]